MKNTFCALVLAGCVSGALGCAAANLYWDGNASTVNSASDNTSVATMTWLSGGNWDDGATSAARASWTAGDRALFGGTFSGTQTVTLGSGIELGDGSVFGGTGSSYKISLTGTAYNQLGNATGTFTVEAGSTLSADAASNNAHNLKAITLNGGTLTSVNGPGGAANDVGYGNWITRGVTVGGSTVSTISSSSMAITSGSFDVADSVAGAGTDLMVSARIISGALTKTGAGTMQLTAANTYTGGTTVNEGTLELAYNSAGAGTLQGGLIVNPGATVALRVANSLGYTGANWTRTITLNGGTLRTDVVGDNGWGTTINMTAGTLSSGVAGGYYSMGQGLSSGNGAVFNVNAAATASLISADLRVRDNAGGSILFNVADGAAAVELDVTGRIQFQSAGGITKSGSGTMQLTGDNTYTGETTLSASGGTMRVSGSGRLGGGTYAGAVSLGSGSTLEFNTSNTQRLNGNITGSGALLYSGGPWLNLGGNNTGFTGSFTQSAGITYLGGGANASSASATWIINGGDVLFGNNGVAGFTSNFGALSGSGGTIQSAWNGTGTFTLSVGALDTNTSYAGTIRDKYTGDGASPKLALTKTGNGNLELTGGANTFSGGLTVNGGKVSASAMGALGAGPITVNAGGLLSYTNAAYAHFNPPSTLDLVGGTLSFDGATQNAHNIIGKTLTMQGGTITSVNGLSGPANDGGFGNFILNNSTLVVSGTAQSTISSTTMQITAGGSFNVGVTGAPVDLLVQAQITGPSTVLKNGSGLMRLTANNAYTGVTTVHAGTLEINGTHSGNGTTTVNAGTLGINGNYSGNGNININNSGRLILNGSHSGSGLITVSAGATLAGVGTMGATDIAAGGILAPGTSAGTIRIGTLDLSANSIVEIELGDPTDPGASDRVVVTSYFNDFGGKLNVSGLPGLGTPAPGASWLVIDYSTALGALNSGANLALGANTTGLDLALDVTTHPGQVLLVVVPEPAAGVLFAFALVLCRRRFLRS